MAEITLHNPTDVSVDEWSALHTVLRDSYAHALPGRMATELDALTHWGDLVAFEAARVDPNTQVGERLNNCQEYLKPRLAVATIDSEIVGYGFAADNISGDPVARAVKRHMDTKRYFWLGEFAVHPDVQRQGIARDIARTLLADARPAQPPTAYIWPDEIPAMQPALENLGFIATGEQEVALFGYDSELVRQVRMQAPSAGHVLDLL